MSEDFRAHAIDSGGWCRTCGASAYVCQKEGFRLSFDRAELAEKRLSEKDQEIARLREELAVLREAYVEEVQKYQHALGTTNNARHEAIARAEKAEAHVKELEAVAKGTAYVVAMDKVRELEVALAAKEKELVEANAAYLKRTEERNAAQKHVVEVLGQNAALSSENSALREAVKLAMCSDDEWIAPRAAKVEKLLATPPAHWQKVAEAKEKALQDLTIYFKDSCEGNARGRACDMVPAKTFNNARSSLAALAELEGKKESTEPDHNRDLPGESGDF